MEHLHATRSLLEILQPKMICQRLPKKPDSISGRLKKRLDLVSDREIGREDRWYSFLIKTRRADEY